MTTHSIKKEEPKQPIIMIGKTVINLNEVVAIVKSRSYSNVYIIYDCGGQDYSINISAISSKNSKIILSNGYVSTNNSYFKKDNIITIYESSNGNSVIAFKCNEHTTRYVNVPYTLTINEIKTFLKL